MKIRLLILFISFSLTGFSQTGSISQFTLADSIGIKFNMTKSKLDSVKWNKMRLNSIESFESYFNYYIIYEFEMSNSNIFIIEREGSNEVFHWTCIIDKKNGQLVDWITTAYDNSEGFTFIKTKIKDEKLLVKEWNMYSKPEESIEEYTIANNKFK